MVWAHYFFAVSLDSSKLKNKTSKIGDLFMWFKELYLNCKV